MVPFSLDTLAVGAACIAASWGLAPGDRGLNMMPLFHSGGIVRNLLAPVLAGSAAILAPGFDPALFWDVAPRLGATWCAGQCVVRDVRENCRASSNPSCQRLCQCCNQAFSMRSPLWTLAGIMRRPPCTT